MGAKGQRSVSSYFVSSWLSISGLGAGAYLDSLFLSGIMPSSASGETGGSKSVMRRNEFLKGVVCAI
jgi:hypothetical protein